MKSAISSTYLFNIVFIFMVVAFAFIMGTVIYYKSFKVNKSILSIIEKYEGYNNFAKIEIENSMQSIGYNVPASSGSCPNRGGVKQDVVSKYRYCVYYYADDDADEGSSNGYYSYGVITYISIDFPFANIFLKIPVFTKSNRIFNFG